MKILFGADLHTTPKTPECRTDDFVAAQRRKLEWIMEQKEKYNAPFITSGDVIDTNSLTTSEVYTMLDLWDGIKMSGILGNHDLPYHKISFARTKMIGQLLKKNYEWYEDDSFIIPTVENFDEYSYTIYPFNFGKEIEHNETISNRFNIALYHGMVTEKPDKFLGGNTAISLLKKFPEYDLIVTGDNHKPFVVEHENRFLINPGCMTRDTVDLVDYKPSIVLFDTETKEWERLYFPIEKDVFNLETSGRVRKNKINTMDQFLATLEEKKEIKNSFKENLTSVLTNENVSDNVRDIIYDCVGGII